MGVTNDLIYQIKFCYNYYTSCYRQVMRILEISIWFSLLLLFLCLTFYPVICYAHVMVPMIIVAYGHVKRLNILSVCPKFVSAIS